ncbi:MAG: hypothetical protein ABI851_03705 [Saprospiraceae bacterium]
MIRSIIIFLFFIVANHSINAQNAQELFGKNKVQYSDDQNDWWIYETSNLIYYWYGKSRKVAEFYISIAEAENKKIREIFEFHLKDKVELVIYSDLSDLSQSNIDLDLYLTPDNWNEEPRVVDQKILLYFNGNHQEALKLLRKGLIKIYFNSIFSGSQIEEAVQKVISLKLPDWFEKGLVEYLSESWTDEDQFNMRSIWKTSRSTKGNFRKFNVQYPSLAGKSMWNYIVQNYGQQAISNWLYMTRIQKNVNQASKLVFQRSLNNLYAEWYYYYSRELNAIPLKKENTRKIKLRKEEQIQDLSYSTLLKSNVFSTNQNGRKRIRLFDAKKSKTKLIYKSGHRNKITIPEINYPLFCEFENSPHYLILDEIRDRNYIFIYNNQHKLISKTILPEDIYEVYDVEAIDEKHIYLSATNNGLSDLFQFNTVSRKYEKLTSDIYDDLNFKISATDSNNILFCSGKPEHLEINKSLDSTVPIFPFDLYKYDILKKQRIYFEECYGGGSIKEFELSPNFKLINSNLNTGKLFYLEKQKDKFNITESFLFKVGNTADEKILKIFKSLKNKYVYRVEDLSVESVSKPIVSKIISQDTTEENYDDSLQISFRPKVFFESEFGDPINATEILKEFYKKSIPFKLSDLKNSEQKYTTSSPLISFNPNQSIAYRLRFSIEDWKTSLSNDLLFGGLNTYSANNPIYDQVHSGILIKTNVKEVFENYNIEFGIRIPTNFIGSEAYVLFNNVKKRWDQSYGLYRRSNRTSIPIKFNTEYQFVTKTFLFNHVAKYALDHYQSFRINSTARNDYQFFKASDRNTIDSSGTNIQTIGVKLEFVYDDALNTSLNLKEGFQGKVFFETNKRFQTTLSNGIHSKGLPGFLFVAGIDARYHLPVLRHSVFSNRIYLNSSFGTQRLLNHLGGTENWLLFKKYNYEEPPFIEGGYSFSQQVTEIRGHPISARKGSAAMLISSELRIPFFHYLLNQNWRNSFLRNLQLLGFIDAGLSWNGFVPSFSEVDKYKFEAENPAVKVQVIYKRNPIIAGTGIGLRTSLFGYFIRLDYAWPIEQLKLGVPIPHVSLGLDF